MDETAAEANQAQAMIRRVSPQGRAEARRLRAASQKRARRLAVRWLAVAVAVFIAYSLLSMVAGPFGAIGYAIAVAAMVVACATLTLRTRERPATAPTVAPGELPLLSARTEAWMARQRPALPPPAVTLLDGIGARIAALTPQLAALDEDSEPADDLRKLMGRELPGLVDQYRAIPDGLRREARADGSTPDARLLHALGVVDRQLADLTRQLGAGAVDGLSTQDRYLGTKYGDDVEPASHLP